MPLTIVMARWRHTGPATRRLCRSACPTKPRRGKVRSARTCFVEPLCPKTTRFKMFRKRFFGLNKMYRAYIENKNSGPTIGVRQWIPFITAIFVALSGALAKELMCLCRRVQTEFIDTSRVPVEGKSSVCVICMKYRIIFYYHQPVSNSIIVCCKHLTHTRMHAHACARTRANACTPPTHIHTAVAVSLFDASQP